MESGRATHGIYFDRFDVGGWRDGLLCRRLGERRRSGPTERLCGASVEPRRPGGTRIPASASSAGRGTAPWRATGCSRRGAGSLGAASEARAPEFRARYRPRLPAGPADGSGAAQSGGKRREATRMPLRHCHLRSQQAAPGHRRGLCRLSSEVVPRGGAALVVGRNGAQSQPSPRAGRPGRALPGSPPRRPCPPPASPPWQRSSARGPAAAKAVGLADVAHGQNGLRGCRTQLLGRGCHGEVAPRRAPPAPPTAGWGAAEGGVGRGWAAVGGGGGGCVRKLARAWPV